ncbi:MAG TPA: hypothetical protein VFE14_09930, partial [Micromonosporaceae bacterium]|nr:hypothetical protein [Micromonosporaceae bacterium]
ERITVGSGDDPDEGEDQRGRSLEELRRIRGCARLLRIGVWSTVTSQEQSRSLADRAGRFFVCT